MAPDKYRNIGAQAEADSGKLIGAQVELPEMVQAQQSGCSIGAAAAQAAAGSQRLALWQYLRQADGETGTPVMPLPEIQKRVRRSAPATTEGAQQ